MKRQMPDGTYRWLGFGSATPRGATLGQGGYVSVGRRRTGGAIETGFRPGRSLRPRPTSATR